MAILVLSVFGNRPNYYCLKITERMTRSLQISHCVVLKTWSQRQRTARERSEDDGTSGRIRDETPPAQGVISNKLLLLLRLCL